jgi:glycosyltransferase involved in cell wall biosynthesis
VGERTGKRILIIGCYPPPFGGQSVHVRELRYFLEKKGNKVKVLNIGETRRIRSDQYVRVKNGIDFFLKSVYFGIKNYTFHLHENGHNHKSWIIIFILGILVRILGGDLFLTLHSGMCPEYVRSRSNLWKILVKLPIHSISCAIAVNNEIRNILIQIGMEKDRIEVIEAFSLSEPIEEVEIPGSIKKYIHSHRPLISCVGFDRPEYGLQFLQPLMNNVTEEFPNAGLIVIGANGLREKESRRNSKSIKWLGLVDHETSLYLIAHSDLFVRPSLSDGDAISVREALAMGIPVVATRVGYRPEGVFTFEKDNMKEFTSTVKERLAALTKANAKRVWSYEHGLYKIGQCYEKYSRAKRIL